MKYIKLILIFILPILAIFLCSFTETDDFFRYEINDEGEVEIIAFAGEKFSNNIKIPSEIEGCPVKVIKEGAFYNNQYIKTLVIPSSVEMIEDSAFAYCEGLEEITFENGETPIVISEVAFEMCSSLKNIEFSNRDTYIDDYAFKDCWSLGKVYFPVSVTYIGHLAFSGCENVIFDCEDCPCALEYAEENNIPTDFLQSDNFLIITALSSSVVIFLIIVIIYKILRKNKKNK